MGLLGRFVPAHLHNPGGLALRLLRSGDRDARGAMLHAALGLVLTPADLLLARRERRLYAAAPAPQRAQLFVCGPPRSGTSLVTQVLLAHLPVAYLSNLSALFPRAPIVAEGLLGRLVGRWRPAFHSYYGRVAALAGPNDGLQLWDRWLGSDRTRVRESLTDAEAEALRRFFGALEQRTGRPFIGKNNNLNLQAAPVGRALPTARFFCLTREPLYLAQALLRARRDIHGADAVPYGLPAPGEAATDPIESVCRQVVHHQRAALAQQALLGADRFRFLSYEAFCADPAATVATVARDLGIPESEIRPVTPAIRFSPSNRARLPDAEFGQLEATLRRVQDEAEAVAR
jgi:hypothetical protein